MASLTPCAGRAHVTPPQAGPGKSCSKNQEDGQNRNGKVCRGVRVPASLRAPPNASLQAPPRNRTLLTLWTLTLATPGCITLGTHDHSAYIITGNSLFGFGWEGVGRDHSTYIIISLNHLGFGSGGGEGACYLHNCLTQQFSVWLRGGEGACYLHKYFTQPFRVWFGGWGGSMLLT